MVGIISLLFISIVYYMHSYRVAIQEELTKMKFLSQETAQHIQTHLEERATTAITLSSAPVIESALLKSNEEFAGLLPDVRQRKIEGLSKKWMETEKVEDPFIQSHMANQVADYLRQQQKLFPDLYGEIFLTNRFGVMIATTGKLTTLAHAHKYWWVAGHDDGKGRIFFDDRGFDISVKGYVLGVVVPIREKDEIIGILKCNINIQGPLSQIVETFFDKKNGTAKIFRSGGLIVIEPGKLPLSTRIPEKIIKELGREETQSTTTYDSGAERLVAISPITMTMGLEKYGFGGSYESIDHIKGNTGEGWHIGIFLDKTEINIITARATRILIVTCIIFTLIISAVALILGSKITKPIGLLTQATEIIGKGDLDSRISISSKDEFGILADSFNNMTENLQKEISQRTLVSKQLQKIEWLMEKTINPNSDRFQYAPPYGDLRSLNTNRLILDSVGGKVFKDIVGDFLDLLDSSSALYEKNGDYALGIFSSGWCRYLDNASRNLCVTKDNQEALDSGEWLCHESCWSDASKVALETGQPVDIECHGGIRLYAVPIFSGEAVVGVINFGYGDPPLDRGTLEEIAGKYHVKVEELLEKAGVYETRPKYILDIAKKRLKFVARLIGAIIERKNAEVSLQAAYSEMEQQVNDRTHELAESNKELVFEIAERKRIEGELRQYSDKQSVLLREVNHRVKNNLTAIISMLHLEEDHADSESRECLQDVVSRVSGLLTVHSMLSSAMWEPLSLTQLCKIIIREVFKGVNAGKSFKVEVSPSEVLVDSDQAHNLTIILNELATNSMKYALPDKDSVHIRVSIHREGDSIHLLFNDDGPGFPEFVLDGDIPTAYIGYYLIFGIVRQSLQGKVELLNDAGAMIKIVFPVMTVKLKSEIKEDE